MMQRVAFVASTLLLTLASALGAQSITLREGAAVNEQVAAGTKVAVPVIVDMSAAGGATFGSLSLGVSWTPTRLSFDSVKTAGFGTLIANTASASTGSLTLSVFDPNGTSSTQTLAVLYFTAASGVGGTRIALSPTVAGDASGTNILSLFRLQHLELCVAATGFWGDANGDNAVNIIDAQQIARFSVGLSVANATAISVQGDVNGDGNVNIIDAQQIARFSVGLTAAAKINTTSYVPPAVASIGVAQTSGTVYVGMSTQVGITPMDAGSNPLNGCYPTAWASSAPGVATVDSTGRISGVSAGTATITATTGGQTAQGTVTVVSAGAPASIIALAGNQQWGISSNALPVAPTFRVRDANGVPVPNATVTLTVSGGSFNSGQPLVAHADNSGTVTGLNWVAPSGPATVTMTATAQGVGTPAIAAANIVGSPLGQTSCIKDGWGVRCWGNGTRGQLGNGANSSSTFPVAVTQPASPLVSITPQATGDHFCGLDAAGHAYCWGSNPSGQLGDGTITSRNVPTAVVGGLSFTSIAAGIDFTCGVSSGTVYCWGIGPNGQLGDSTHGSQHLSPTPIIVPSSLTFTQVTASSSFACALASNGDAWCWGSNTVGMLGDGTSGSLPHFAPTQVVGGIKFTQISSAWVNTCGLTAAGAAYCWGGSGSGQLGLAASTSGIGSPQLIPGGHVFSEIAVGITRVCAVTIAPDNSTWCWGSNTSSVLGDGSGINRSTPVPLAVTLGHLYHGGFGTTSAGYSCGTEPGGDQTYCWGANGAGQVGDGGTSTRTTPTFVLRSSATPGAPLAMEMLSTSLQAQSASSGAQVPAAPAVVVRDGLGASVQGVTVNWSVLSGAGSVTNASSVTDASGVASSGGWTLGVANGTQTLQATVNGILINGSPSGVPLRTTFVAYGTNTPAFAVKVMGDSAWGPQLNGTFAGVPLVVKVTDASNNPMSGVAVTFALGASSGSFQSGQVSQAINTDASGQAALPTWVPNSALGTQSTVTATVPGIATPLVFTFFNGNNSFGGTSCELTQAGAAMCAGLNTYGTVGDGTTANRSTFVPVSGGLAFTSLAEGTDMTKCGLVGTTAYCWGNNALGQVGDGTQVNRSVPTPVSGGLAFASIANGGQTTCGITTSNQLYCWGWTGTAGWNEGANLRGRVHLAPTLVNTGGLTFTKVTLSDDGLCGLSTTGTVNCLSDGRLNGDGTNSVPGSFTTWQGGPYVDVQAGNTMACALDAAGLAYCLGTNQGGSQGTATGIASATFTVPTQVYGGITFADIHLGNFRACGRRSNGDVFCWGINPGTGISTSGLDRPTQIPGFKASSVRETTFRITCAKSLTFELYCWGPQSNVAIGVVGDGTTVDRQSPTAVLGWPDGPAAGVAVAMFPNIGTYTQVAGLAVSPAPSVTVKDRLGNPVSGVPVTFTAPAGSGIVVGGGSVITDVNGVAAVTSWTLSSVVGLNRLDANAPGLAPVSFSAGSVAPAGSIAIVSGNNQVMPDNYSIAPINVQVLDGSGNPISGTIVTFTATTGNGTINGVANSSVQFSTNSSGVATITSTQWVPPTVASASGTTYTLQASVAGLAPISIPYTRLPIFNNGSSNPPSSICRLDQSGNAYCWGGNAQGAVGNGNNTDQPIPVAVTGGITFASLAESPTGFHQCGLTAGGQAYCWGNNNAGQLGTGGLASSNVPVPVAGGLTFTKLSVGTFTTCGLTAANALYCWGAGDFSLRGDGALYTTATQPVAVNTAGRVFSNISVGEQMICALDASGQAFCWGENGVGQLGNGTSTNAATALVVSTSARFTKLSTSTVSTCGVTTSGAVLCWGFNSVGQTGNGNTTNQFVPVNTGLSGITDVRMGIQSACAMSTSALYCWGGGGSGDVGNGTFTGSQSSPVQIAQGMTPTSLLSMSRGIACATTTRQLYCWGGNGQGVGDNTTANRNLPTPVQWPATLTTDPAISAAVTAQSFTAAAGAPQTVTARVRNAFGAGVANQQVFFIITGGGGNVTTITGTTDSSGFVSTSWTLAGASGTVNTLDLRVSGIPNITFTGTVP